MKPTDLKYQLKIVSFTKKENLKYSVAGNGKKGFKSVFDNILNETNANKLNIRIISQKNIIDAENLELIKK